MSVPEEVRDEIKRILWLHADEIGWLHLPPNAKSRQYDNWTKDPKIGGLLERFIDQRFVRTYLKDTLLRGYTRACIADSDRPLRVLGIRGSIDVAELYQKPHGRRLTDGRVVAWGRAADWKSILLAVHERAYEGTDFMPYGVVFLDAVGRYGERQTREMVEDAASKLEIRVFWLDT